MRLALIAFVLTFAALVVGTYMFAEQQRLERRAAAEYNAARSPEPPAPAAPVPAEPPAAAATPAPAAEPAPEPKPEPQRAAEIDSRKLNDVLKAAAAGDWGKVDVVLIAGDSASVGSSRPAAPSARAGQAKQAIDAMEYDKAVEALKAVVAENPDDAEAHNRLAFALLRQGKAEEAHSHVTRSLALAPLSGATWANAAEILAERDNGVAAQAALRVAIHLSRDRKRTQAFLDQVPKEGKFGAVVAEVKPHVKSIPPARRSTP